MANLGVAGGYVVTGILDVAEIKIGDTLTLNDSPAKDVWLQRGETYGF